MDRDSVITAINAGLLEVDSECKAVYREFCPKDFERPSYLIKCQSYNVQPHSYFYRKVTCVISVESATDNDERSEVKSEDIQRAISNILKVFRRGYIEAGSEILHVSELNAEDVGKYAYVSVVFEFIEPIDNSEDEQDYENMECIVTKIRVDNK